MTFSFSNLSLSGITAAAGANVLPVGKFACTVKKAEIKDTKAGTGKVLAVLLVSDAGLGVITDNINVHNQSKEAERIGLEQLKSLLVNGGHVDPDNIGEHGLNSIIGLKVGVIVGSETYQGQLRSKVSGYMKHELVGKAAAGGSVAKPAAPASKFGDDDIPFILNTLDVEIGTSKQRRMARYDF